MFGFCFSVFWFVSLSGWFSYHFLLLKPSFDWIAFKFLLLFPRVLEKKFFPAFSYIPPRENRFFKFPCFQPTLEDATSGGVGGSGEPGDDSMDQPHPGSATGGKKIPIHLKVRNEDNFKKWMVLGSIIIHLVQKLKDVQLSNLSLATSGLNAEFKGLSWLELVKFTIVESLLWDDPQGGA